MMSQGFRRHQCNSATQGCHANNTSGSYDLFWAFQGNFLRWSSILRAKKEQLHLKISDFPIEIKLYIEKHSKLECLNAKLNGCVCCVAKPQCDHSRSLYTCTSNRFPSCCVTYIATYTVLQVDISLHTCNTCVLFKLQVLVGLYHHVHKHTAVQTAMRFLTILILNNFLSYEETQQ